MKTRFCNLVAGVGAAALLAACGGGGGGDGQSNATPPTAVASANPTTVAVGNTVTLDGSASSSPRQGATLQYQWSLTSVPGRSQAAVIDAQSDKARFVPDRAGQYQVNLFVNDGTAGGNGSVTVTATNPNPEAVIAQETQNVLLGATVTLDGSPSLPPTGQDASALRYEWTLTEQPTGDPYILLQDADRARATFVAEKNGQYKARLRVSHGDKTSPAEETTILVGVTNQAPIIKVKVPENLVRGQQIVLDASETVDPDGDKLSYRWRFPATTTNSSGRPGRPTGSEATLGNTNDLQQVSFVPDIAGRYYVELIVYDGSVAVTETVELMVKKPDNAPAIKPRIWFPGPRIECEQGSPYPFYQMCSFEPATAAESDVITYSWTYWNVDTPQNKLYETTSSTGTASLRISSAASSTWHVQVVANDGQNDSNMAQVELVVKMGANTAPTANAKVDLERVMLGTAVVLDGSGSTDPQGDPLTFSWRWEDRPTGSRAEIVNATSEKASFTPDVAGLYTARLDVTDPHGLNTDNRGKPTVNVFAKARNNPPLVVPSSITAGQPLITGSGLTIDPGKLPSRGVVVYDPDLDQPLHVLNIVTQAPQDSALANKISEFRTISGRVNDLQLGIVDRPGQYRVDVTVSDGIDTVTSSHSLTAVACQDYPTLLLKYASAGETEDPARRCQFNLYFPYAQDPLGGYGGYNYHSIDFNTLNSLLVAYAAVPLTTSYRLIAFDRDYTITGLQTSSIDPAFQPSFQGLSEGMVIPKGQEVVFSLVRPEFPDEQALSDEMRRLYQDWAPGRNPPGNAESGPKYRALAKQAYDRVDGQRFTWSFRVAEKEGYTFHVGR